MSEAKAGTTWIAEEAQGATFIELFFDLVFVFAVTSITSSVLHDLDWSSVGHNLLILWLVWWAWTQFTWTLNPADTTHTAVELVTLAATAAAFFMAQAIPDAFTTGGAWFAFSYVIVRILGLGLQLRLLTNVEENATSVVAWVTGSSLGLAAVIAGGLVSGTGRVWLWGLAVALDVWSAARAGRGSWKLHAEHFAERHGLIVIIALGESLIAAGIAIRDVSRDASFAVGAIAAVVAVCALWWIYFALAKETMEEHLGGRTLEETGGTARDVYSFGHLPIIAGVIGFAVAIERILGHLHDDLGNEALIALVLGTLLYLGGITYGIYRCGAGRVAPWLGGVAVVIAAALAFANVGSGLNALVAVSVALVAFAAWLTRRDPSHP